MVITFEQWLSQSEEVDFKELESIYDKARISVELVKMYKPQLLYNIATIANLESGAYGLYNSGENEDILSPAQQQRIIIQSKGRITKKQLDDARFRRDVWKQYFPYVDEREINPSDTIHVNVRKILNDPKVNSDYDAVVQIASTIVHETVHDKEFRDRNQTSEMGPRQEENAFTQWLQQSQVQQFIQQRLGQFGV